MKFEITYTLQGVRKDTAIVPDSIPLPDNWSEWTPYDKDEWIYTNQTSHETTYEDIHFVSAEAVEWVDE